MRGLVGLLVTALIVVLGYWLYASKMQSKGAPGTPAQVISTVGDELYSSGALAVKKSGRAGYAYSAETTSDGFTVTARCDAATTPGCSDFSVDQSMQVQQVP
ncbi:MAG: hypothetical protein WBE21_06220 [Candidatus Acidiferrales bacterium]